jgi:serine/threonine protein kinase
MPAPANVTEFVEVVRRSGLVPEDRLQAEVARLKLSATPPQSIDQIAAAMVRAGLLTRFQAKQVKIGRYKRFEIAGKYRLLELLGIGGMGAVYLCEHMFMKRLVALKVLPVEKLEDPSALHRFYREARAVAALDHPNIVRAYDIDKFEQLHFLVMEYVDGTSLQEIVARNGPLDPGRAADYIAQAVHGLHHAHELGMVHRDIKPGNLLLERTGLIKILDMGLARFFDQRHDNVTEKFDNNSVLGTADYLAPEQALTNVVDVRADLYSLGGTFYYMLTGQSPFPEGTIAHKLLCHQNDEPRPVGSFRKDVPPELLAILHKLMRKNPAERYQTPAELYDDLAPWAEPEPVPPPAHEMPDLCPAVLALTGHAADRARNSGARLSMTGTRTGIRLTPRPPSSYPGMPLGSSSPDSQTGTSALSQMPTGTAPSTEPLASVAVVRPGDLRDSVVSLRSHPPSGTRRLGVQAPDRAGKFWMIVGLIGGLGIAGLAVALVLLVLSLT